VHFRVIFYEIENHFIISLGIDLFQEQTVAVFLYTIEGIEINRRVEQGKLSYRFDFDLSNNSAGVYIARIITNERVCKVNCVS
jgi:hypothetical protein